MKIILILFSVFYLHSQTELVFLKTTTVSVVTEIEEEIIENMIRLHNLKSEGQFTYRIERVGVFSDIFKRLDNKEAHIIGINSISVTSLRKQEYDFSSVYLPSKEVIVSLKSLPSSITWKTKNSKMAYQENTTQERIFNRLKEEYGLIGIPYKNFKSRYTALNNKEANFTIADNIEVWNEKHFKIVTVLKEQLSDGIALCYPKGSALRLKLNKFMEYYIKSAKFNKLVEEKYGKEVRDYFKRNL